MLREDSFWLRVLGGNRETPIKVGEGQEKKLYMRRKQRTRKDDLKITAYNYILFQFALISTWE